MANRYSDQELEEFKTLILAKIEKAEKEVVMLEDQKDDHSESLNDNGYDIDENHGYADVEFLSSLIQRQKKHINDLQLALLRIKNKSYGICVVTGELIDKKRLMAVPTTTKSLQAKLDKDLATTPALKVEPEKKKEKKRPPENKIITRIIKKNPAPAPKSSDLDDDDLDLDLEDLDLDLDDDDNPSMADDSDVDFDNIVDESTLDDELN